MAFQADGIPQPQPTASSLDAVVRHLKASADPTRLRLLALLSRSQLSVNEIVQVTGQSQPTVSRNLKTLCDAGLLERSPEGSWVFYRVPDEGPGAALAQHLISSLPSADPVIVADEAALDNVRHVRSEAAAQYFAENAERWESLRALHGGNSDTESAILAMTSGLEIRRLLDIGTGTGRVLELLAPQAERGVGLDVSHQMLSIARANLAAAGLTNSSVRHGNLYQPPFDPESFDLIVMHQVLHYLENAGDALDRVAGLLEPGGRMLIVDFAPHALETLRADHSHRRLGIHGEELVQWANRAGLTIEQDKTLHPPIAQSESLIVRLWMLRKYASADSLNWLRAV
jgi:ubiquinone/menaquinone biosynthesis C-methylase UbiE